MGVAVALGVGLVTAVASLAGSQIGYLWSSEELTAKADLVVIAEPAGTDDSGRRSEHPDLEPGLLGVELTTAFKVLAMLKSDTRASSSDTSQVTLRHYRIDWDEWRRRNPPQPGLPPPGLVNGGSVLDFSNDTGPYLLFLARAADFYEPLSGRTFPSNSIFQLQKFGRLPGR